MARKKIAPVLSALVQDLTLAASARQRKSYPMPGDAGVARLATGELRALVAVASAVTGPEAVQPECCWGYDLKTKRCRCSLHRAIEQLDRVSAPGARGEDAP